MGRGWKAHPFRVGHPTCLCGFRERAWISRRKGNLPTVWHTNKELGFVRGWSQTKDDTEHTLPQDTDVHVVTSVGGSLRAWNGCRKQPWLWRRCGSPLPWPRPLSHCLGHRDVPQQVRSALDQVIQCLLHRGIVKIDECCCGGWRLHSTHRWWWRCWEESTLGGSPEHGIHGKRIQWGNPEKSVSWQSCQSRLLGRLRLWRGRGRSGGGQGWHQGGHTSGHGVLWHRHAGGCWNRRKKLFNITLSAHCIKINITPTQDQTLLSRKVSLTVVPVCACACVCVCVCVCVSVCIFLLIHQNLLRLTTA